MVWNRSDEGEPSSVRLRLKERSKVNYPRLKHLGFLGASFMKTDLCKWVVAHDIPGKTQDDGRDKVRIIAVFITPDHAEDFIRNCLPEETSDRFFVSHVDQLNNKSRRIYPKK